MPSKGRNNKYTIEEIRNVILQDNKRVLLMSREYVGAAKPLLFKCLICEHKFRRSWNSINVPGTHCPACGKNGDRVTKLELQNLVESRGYIIKRLLKSTHRAGTRLLIECSLGHVTPTTYRAFLKKEIKNDSCICKHCSQMGNTSKNRERKRALRQTILQLGYTMKTDKEIQHVHDKHIFYCSEGHERYTNFNNLMETPECGQCRGRIVKHTVESITQNLLGVGIIYVKGFITSQKPIEYICVCGTRDVGYYHDLMMGGRCYNCSSRRYWDYDSVKEFFSEHDCVLLDKQYIKSKDRLNFICSCGETANKPFSEYKLRPYCYECGNKKKARGEDHPCWNPELSQEDREHSRKYPEYKAWRELVFSRDSYTCQCCEDDRGGNLEAHHILNYSEHKEVRLEISNGITLCQDCHVGFHMSYGFSNNNEDQLEEYLQLNKPNKNIA